jgi:hypothetical protein
MRLININTTAWKEEDFMIYTDLRDDQIITIIEPFVLAERKDPDDDETYYDNQILVAALQEAHPNHTVKHYTLDDIDQIRI